MPRNNITNIHDKFIKQILSNKELAVEFLQQYLPEPLNSILDFETLNQQDIRANLCIQKRITDQCHYVAEVLF